MHLKFALQTDGIIIFLSDDYSNFMRLQCDLNKPQTIFFCSLSLFNESVYILCLRQFSCFFIHSLDWSDHFTCSFIVKPFLFHRIHFLLLQFCLIMCMYKSNMENDNGQRMKLCEERNERITITINKGIFIHSIRRRVNHHAIIS